MGTTEQQPRRRTLTALLTRVVVLVTLIPFLPVAYLGWTGYRSEIADLEREIQTANTHIARLAVNYLDLLLRQLRLVSEAFPGGSPPSGDELPAPVRGVRWELVAPDGAVTGSQVSGTRVGSACGYEELLARVVGGDSLLSGVGRWIEDFPPTVLFVRALGDSGRHLVGVVDPEALHGDMHAWSAGGVDRHVYAMDGRGSLIFYSDLTISQRGEDLSSNPPVRLLVEGGEGEIRYRSVVSRRPRLGTVHRLREADWGVIVSGDVGSAILGLRSRYFALAASLAFALAAALAILMWTSRRLVAPVLDIDRALRSTNRAAHEPLAVRHATRQIAEYDDLVRAFDDLTAEVVAVEKELVQAEKTSLLGQLASGLAHEMGTPLNVITGNAQYLLRKTGAEDPARPALEQVIAQAKRIAAMIRRLLDLSRPGEARLVPIDVATLVRQAVEVVPGMNRRVEVRTEIDPEIPQVLADPKLLEHALLNLVVNACQAMPDGGTLDLEAGVAAAEDGPRELHLRVTDSGGGIPSADLGRVFEPFFTTKPPSEGTGLGLAIAERIVRQHGGRLAVASIPGEGATFTIILPCGRPGERGREESA